MIGSSLSVTVTVKEHVVELIPVLSTALHTTVLVPVGKTDPLAKPENKKMAPPEQLSEYVGFA
jgi:hypothetical protein